MSLPSSGQDSNWQVNSGINVFEGLVYIISILYNLFFIICFFI